MSKNNGQYKMWIGLALLLGAVILIVVVAVNMMRGEETGNVKISGEAEVEGLVCKDTVSVHPALIDVSADSHTNTITANFRDDKLSSISLVYEGDYRTEQRAEGARASGAANYNLTLSNKYNEDDGIFSSNFSVDGARMQLVQTARDISKINNNTVTYFLLDQGTGIAKTLEGLEEQYEAKGFSCEETK